MWSLFILGTRKICFPGRPKIQNIFVIFQMPFCIFFLNYFWKSVFCKEPKNVMTDSKSKKKTHCFCLKSMHNYTTFFKKKNTKIFRLRQVFFFCILRPWYYCDLCDFFLIQSFGLLIPWTRESYNDICF